MNPRQGDVLGNRYELTDRIASGGMGDVWAATDRVLGRTVAVKVMRMLTSDESTFAARFRDEARHTAALAHPNIAAVYDYGEDEGRAFLVMELVPGHPLSSLIATGPLPLEQTRLILGQCALALASAHAAGVVHRDVKPANIMITPEGKVKLTDFGIARAVDAAGHTRTGEVMGTPQYLSPEQAQGQRVTGATDLYSLGVVGYEMLAGTRPFDAGSPVATALAHITETPPPLPDHVTDPLRSAIEACLAKDPAARPSSAASLAALLGMPVAGVSSASLATSVIPLTELGPTAAMPAPFTPAATEIVSPPFPAGHMAGHMAGNVGGNMAAGGVAAGIPSGGPAAYRGSEPPEKRRGGLGWWWLPVLAILLVAGFFVWQTNARQGGPSTPQVTVTRTLPTASRPSATSSAPTTTTTPVKIVTIVESDYVGVSVGLVRSDLTTIGFADIVTKEVASDKAKGIVLAVSPKGPVKVTERIVLAVSSGLAPTSPATSTATTGGTGG